MLILIIFHVQSSFIFFQLDLDSEAVQAHYLQLYLSVDVRFDY
jgi:hypothetical protein